MQENMKEGKLLVSTKDIRHKLFLQLDQCVEVLMLLEVARYQHSRGHGYY